MTEKQIRWQKRSLILYRLKGMLCFPSPEKGVLTHIEIYRLNTTFSIIKKVIQDSVKSSIELGFNATERRPICGKPVVDGSKYCKEHKDMEERLCQR